MRWMDVDDGWLICDAEDEKEEERAGTRGRGKSVVYDAEAIEQGISEQKLERKEQHTRLIQSRTTMMVMMMIEPKDEERKEEEGGRKKQVIILYTFLF